MPIPTGYMPIESNASLEDLRDSVAYLQRSIEYHLTGQLDTANAREFGGWYIGKDSLTAKNGVVGLSSTATGGDDIRIWAGDTDIVSSAFRVYESGRMVATDGEFSGSITASDITGGTITGALIQTALPGVYPRIEFASSTRLLRAVGDDPDNQIQMRTNVTNGIPVLSFHTADDIVSHVLIPETGISGDYMIQANQAAFTISNLNGSSMFMDRSGNIDFEATGLFRINGATVATQSWVSSAISSNYSAMQSWATSAISTNNAATMAWVTQFFQLKE